MYRLFNMKPKTFVTFWHPVLKTKSKDNKTFLKN